jgi:polyisoprenoid-binding protein YceI
MNSFNFSARRLFGIFAIMLAQTFVAELCQAAGVSAEKLAFEASKGSVSFLATGKPSAIKIKGEGAGPAGSLIITGHAFNGSVHFDLRTLSTGIEMRDHHMKEKYLEVDKFPDAELKFKDAVLSETNPDKIKGSAFSGTLKLHGVEKPVQGTFSSESTVQGLKINSSMTVKLSDFGIQIPSYLGITVAEDVKIDIASTVQWSAVK